MFSRRGFALLDEESDFLAGIHIPIREISLGLFSVDSLVAASEASLNTCWNGIRAVGCYASLDSCKNRGTVLLYAQIKLLHCLYNIIIKWHQSYVSYSFNMQKPHQFCSLSLNEVQFSKNAISSVFFNFIE